MLAWLESLFLRKTSSAHLQLDALDGLRGMAVLFVVLSHLSNAKLHLLPGLDMRGTGKYGVYLFFVLSAFLLTLPLVSGPARALAEPRRWLRYALRRMLRIFPLYFTVLTVNYAATLLGPLPAFFQMSGEQLVNHLLLQEGIGLYWTIPVEFTYYLVLPFVAALYATVLRCRLVPVTITTAAAIAACLWLWPPARSEINTLHLGPYLPTFLCGSYAAFLHAKLREGDAPLSTTLRGAADLLAFTCALAVAALVPSAWSSLSGEQIDSNHFHRDYLLFGVLWSGCVLGILNGHGWLAWIFSLRVLRLVGVVSFSVYLWHLPIARAIYLGTRGSGIEPVALAWSSLAVALLASMLSFVLIERPFVRSQWVSRRIQKIGSGAHVRPAQSS